MRHTLNALLLTLCALTITTSGCGGGLASLNETLSMWRSGDRSAAVERSAREYDRYRDANDLDEATIRAWADALSQRIDEEPVIARGERPGALPLDRLDTHQGALDSGIRLDLLSHAASRVARAIGVVGGLGLKQHASVLITLVYEPRVIETDGDVLEGLDAAERTVTLKRMALDALERLR